MTYNEFVQQACLQILVNNSTKIMEEVYEQAVYLADLVFDGEKELAELPAPVYLSDDPLKAPESLIHLYEELEKYDVEIRDKKVERAKNMGWNSRYYKSGYRNKMAIICEREKITNVRDLVALTSKGFGRKRNVGIYLIEAVTICLKRLYKIEAW